MIRSHAVVVACLLMLAGVTRATDLSGMWWIVDRSGTANISGKPLPLRPDAAALYARNRAAAATGTHVPIGQNPCMPEGMPRLMLSPYPLQILQRPEQITFLHERMHMVRFIYMRSGIPDDVDQSYVGYSTGRWEGGALVVETTHFSDQTVIDSTGIPHSDAMRIIERLALRGGGKLLSDTVTVDDPQFYTRPWSITIEFQRRSDVRLMEDVCTFGPPQRGKVSP
jgi:hypothetical protein